VMEGHVAGLGDTKTKEAAPKSFRRVALFCEDTFREAKDGVCPVHGSMSSCLSEYVVHGYPNPASRTELLDEALAIMEEMVNVFYGVCLNEWGMPDCWPEDRQGVRTYRKLKAFIERARE